MTSIADIQKNAQTRMDQSIDAFKQSLSRIRTGRANPALLDSITDMAVSLPEHTVVPYPNVSKKHYRKNIPLEVYDHDQEEATG